MVSRKKAKGEARKASKVKVDEKKEDSSTAAAPQQQEGTLEAQIQVQRLLIDSLVCRHGFDPFPEGHLCDQFLRLYLGTFDAGASSNPAQAMITAMDAVEDEYPEVLWDSSKMKQILSFFSSDGTQRILNGDKPNARVNAAMILLFEELIAVELHKTRAVLDFLGHC
jgi:hypothetical protein